MTRFSGVEVFSIPRTAVAEKLSDASVLAACVPDARIESASADAAEWRARAKLGFATAALESKLTIAERQAGKAVTFHLTNRTSGGSLSVTTRLAFADHEPSGTQVAWESELTARSGLVKLVPAAVLQSQIESLLGDLWQNVRQTLQNAAGPSAP